MEINTLENAIYMNMKNDISFVFASYLNLYEHQPTVSPNMPLSEAVERAVEECIREEGRATEIVETGIEFGLSENDIISRLQKRLDITVQKAQEYLELFGKQPV